MADFTTFANDIVSKVESVSKVYYEPDETAKGLISEIGASGAIKTQEHKWYQKDRRPRTSAVKALYTASDASLDVDDTSYFVLGQVIGFDTGDDNYEVTAITDADTLAVTLITGTSIDHAVDAVVYMRSVARAEGSTGASVKRNPEYTVSNITQIMVANIKATESRIAQDEEIAGQKFEDDVTDEISQFALNDAYDIWYGVKKVAATSADVSYMGGVDGFIADKGFLQTSTGLTATTLFKFVDDYVNGQIGKGGKLWMNPADKEIVGAFDDSILRRDVDSKGVGHDVIYITTKQGNVMDIVTDTNIKLKHIYLLNAGNIKRRPLIPIKAEYLGKVGLYREMEISKEETLEVNASGQMGRLIYS